MEQTSTPVRTRRARRRAARHRGTALVLAAVPLGLLGSGALVWQASYAAFTAQTANPSNSWSSGTVALSDDDAGTAMFSAANLKPGDTGAKCIAVTYGGSVASSVKMYVAPGARTGDTLLAQNLDLVVESGAGGGSGSCTGFTPSGTAYTGTLDGFATAHTSFANGYGTWNPTAAGQVRTYRVTYTLRSTAPDTVQGRTTGATFTWEAQST